MDDAGRYELYTTLQTAIAEQAAALIEEIRDKKAPSAEERAAVLTALSLADLALHGIETADE